MATTTYVTLATVKDALHVTDTARDALLNAAIAAASRSVDDKTGRRFWIDDAASARVLNPMRRVVCDRDGSHLLVGDIATATGLVVEVGAATSWTTLAATTYELEPTDALGKNEPVTSILRIGAAWPCGAGQRVRVTAKWGWPAVPDAVSQATLIQATRFYKRKDSPEGVAGSAEWGAIRLGRIDPDVAALLASYVLPGIA